MSGGVRGRARAAAWIVRRPFAALVVLVFALEWAVMIPDALASRGMLPFALPKALGLVAGWGPGLAAAIVALALGGRPAVRRLFGRYLVWRVHVGYWLVALLATAAFILGGIGVHVALGGAMPVLPAAGASAPSVATTFGVMVVAGLVLNLEDVAWRGVALPLLQPRYGALGASVVIGVLEALTHLPYFFVPGDFRQLVGIWFFVFSLLIVIVMTWLYNSTRGSLLLVAVYHAAQNAWSNLLDTNPSPGPNDLGPFIWAVAWMAVAAAAVIAYGGAARLTRRPPDELPTL
ncbi:MAG: CPBP family intramembrane glutamic endopeptidase [Anaerolineae bacterium]